MRWNLVQIGLLFFLFEPRGEIVQEFRAAKTTQTPQELFLPRPALIETTDRQTNAFFLRCWTAKIKRTHIKKLLLQGDKRSNCRAVVRENKTKTQRILQTLCLVHHIFFDFTKTKLFSWDFVCTTPPQNNCTSNDQLYVRNADNRYFINCCYFRFVKLLPCCRISLSLHQEERLE